MPSNEAVIYIDDFESIPKLVAYLVELAQNEEKYEKHRNWRKDFDPSVHISSDLLTKSWPCRLCEWALSKTLERDIKNRFPFPIDTYKAKHLNESKIFDVC